MFLSAILCMAEAIYFESRGEPVLGQVAVAQVIRNRINDSRYPDHSCDVVHQHMQFEYYWDGKKEIIDDEIAHYGALGISVLTLLGLLPDVTEGATHFDSLSQRPRWVASDPIKIGNHYFYLGN